MKLAGSPSTFGADRLSVAFQLSRPFSSKSFGPTDRAHPASMLPVPSLNTCRINPFQSAQPAMASGVALGVGSFGLSCIRGTLRAATSLFRFRHPPRGPATALPSALCKSLQDNNGFLDCRPLGSEFIQHLDNVHSTHSFLVLKVVGASPQNTRGGCIRPVVLLSRKTGFGPSHPSRKPRRLDVRAARQKLLLASAVLKP